MRVLKMLDDIEHDEDVDRPDLLQNLTRDTTGSYIETSCPCELGGLVRDLDTVDPVMSFRLEQKKSVCGTDFEKSPRRNSLAKPICYRAKLGSIYMLAAHVIGVSAFCVAVEKICSVICHRI